MDKKRELVGVLIRTPEQAQSVIVDLIDLLLHASSAFGLIVKTLETGDTVEATRLCNLAKDGTIAGILSILSQHSEILTDEDMERVNEISKAAKTQCAGSC